MWRNITGAIIGLTLSFLTPGLYFFLCSDFIAAAYSNHYNYVALANDGKYMLIPSEYNEWYAFRDGVTENYGKKIIAKKGLVQLHGIARRDFLLKSGNTYYKLEPTNSPTFFELKEVEHSKVNPYLYLLRYLGIYLSLVIIPVMIGFAINKYLLKVKHRWLQIITAASTLLGFVITCMYLNDWWKLFHCWVLS